MRWRWCVFRRSSFGSAAAPRAGRAQHRRPRAPHPYFHDNSAKTLRAVVDHYGDRLFRQFPIRGALVTLTEQDREDIVAFLRLF